MVRPLNPVNPQSSFILNLPPPQPPRPPLPQQPWWPRPPLTPLPPQEAGVLILISFLFQSIFIRGYLIHYIPVICKRRRVGHGHGDNAHIHLYSCIHGSEKVGTDIFIYQTQLLFFSVNLTACILINNRKCISQTDIEFVLPHVGLLFARIKQLLNIIISC